MADAKITELTALTSLATADVLAIVDDTTGTPTTKKVTVANLFGAIAGNVTINEGGGDYDLRVEGDTATSLLICDAGLEAVQIGDTTAGVIADFRAAGVVINENGADQDLRIEGDTATSLLVCNAGLEAVQIGTTTAGAIADFRSSTIVFNEASGDIDFRIESNTGTHAIFVDGGTPEVVINDDSIDMNFRVESNGNANMLLVDAGADCVGIGVADPDTTLEIYKVGTQLKLSGGAADYVTFAVAADGALTITTVDADAAEGDIELMPDGDVGIGAAPVCKLHVLGAAANVSLAANNGFVNFDAATVQCQIGRSADSPYGVWIQAKNSNLDGSTIYPIAFNPLGGDISIGASTPAARLHVDQSSTAGLVPVLLLDQADIDLEFIKLIGSSQDGQADRSLCDVADLANAGALVGWFQIYVEDIQATNPITDGVYYVPFYAAPSA